MSEAQIALIISGLSLLVAFVALYRAELRGPSLKLAILQAPESWTRYWQWQSPQMGQHELYLSLTGSLAVVVHNSGPRAGVIFDIGYRVEPVPAPFNAEVVCYVDGLTLTVAGKATESLRCNLIFSRWNTTMAEALEAFGPSGSDFRVTVTYKANRSPFGRVRSGQATQMVSRRPLADNVNEWAKHPPDRPNTP